MKKISTLFWGIILSSSIMLAQGKQPYSVLYVGGSSNYDTFAGSAGIDSITLAKDVKQRSASFEKFLKRRFKTVKAIEGKDYRQSMSDHYDVTILDGEPGQTFRERIYDQYPDGGTDYSLPIHFTPDFNRPIVCIAESADRYLRNLGAKADWFCMCLFYDAHHWDAEHEIFKGPWKVQPKTFKEATYTEAFEYGPIYGYEVPDSILEFNIDGPKFQARKGHRIGVVARPWGFMDSPETEIISSGVCGKSIDAIAIGRHANVFHWGFSAMPDEMSQEGQALFANAVVYMAQRGPERIIARKLSETIPVRSNAIAKRYLVSREAYKALCKTVDGFVQAAAANKTAAQEKQARGETLSDIEMYYLNCDTAQIRRSNSIEWTTYIKEQGGSAFHICGYNEQMYQSFYTDNLPYFYAPDPFGYELDVDEDARDLGIANNDIRIIEKAITLMEQNEAMQGQTDPYGRPTSESEHYALGRRIAERYTLCRFEKAKEWREWYDQYKEKMFFSEAGGWVWLINTQDADVPGNDYSVLPQYRFAMGTETPADKAARAARKAGKPNNNPTANVQQTAEPTPDNPVSLTAYFDPATSEIVLTQQILSGWHTYARLGADETFVQTEVNITLDGGQKVGELKTPTPSPYAGGSAGSMLYQGMGDFRQQVTGHGTAKVSIFYQACDDSQCKIPTTKEFEVNF